MTRRRQTALASRGPGYQETAVQAALQDQDLRARLRSGTVRGLLLSLEGSLNLVLALARLVDGSGRPRGVEEGRDRTLRSAYLALRLRIPQDPYLRGGTERAITRHLQATRGTWAAHLAPALVAAILANDLVVTIPGLDPLMTYTPADSPDLIPS